MKKKKNGNALVSYNPDAGNVEQNVAMFNHASGSDCSSCTNEAVEVEQPTAQADNRCPQCGTNLVDTARGKVCPKCSKQNMNEANYGGAFDVDPQAYFTIDDMYEVEDYIMDTVDGVKDAAAYIDNYDTLCIAVTTDTEDEYEVSEHIDMRRIRKPSDILKYARTCGFKLSKDIGASLSESVETDSIIDKIKKNDLHYNKEIDAYDIEVGPYYVQFQDRETHLYPDVLKYRHVSPSVASHTWGRVWKDEKLIYTADGPKFIVRQKIADFLSSLDESLNNIRSTQDKADVEKKIDELEDAADDADDHNNPGGAVAFRNAAELLREDFDEEELKAPLGGPDTGISNMIIDAINDEWEAIKKYNDMLATCMAEGKTEIIDIIQDIVAEENVHVGQLQKALELYSPNVAAIEDGEEEAAEELDPEDSVDESSLLFLM